MSCLVTSSDGCLQIFENVLDLGSILYEVKRFLVISLHLTLRQGLPIKLDVMAYPVFKCSILQNISTRLIAATKKHMTGPLM